MLEMPFHTVKNPVAFLKVVAKTKEVRNPVTYPSACVAADISHAFGSGGKYSKVSAPWVIFPCPLCVMCFHISEIPRQRFVPLVLQVKFAELVEGGRCHRKRHKVNWGAVFAKVPPCML